MGKWNILGKKYERVIQSVEVQTLLQDPEFATNLY